MRDPVSLPLLPRSNLQPQSLRREDEADPGSNHKSVSYRYVEPQIYSIIGMYVYVFCCKRRRPGAGAGGFVVRCFPARRSSGAARGFAGRPGGGTPQPGSGGVPACLRLSRRASSGLSLLCRERAGAFQCKWGTWSSAAPTNQRSLGHFELILKLRKPGAGNGALPAPSSLSPCSVSSCVCVRVCVCRVPPGAAAASDLDQPSP